MLGRLEPYFDLAKKASASFQHEKTAEDLPHLLKAFNNNVKAIDSNNKKILDFLATNKKNKKLRTVVSQSKKIIRKNTDIHSFITQNIDENPDFKSFFSISSSIFLKNVAQFEKILANLRLKSSESTKNLTKDIEESMKSLQCLFRSFESHVLSHQTKIDIIDSNLDACILATSEASKDLVETSKIMRSMGQNKIILFILIIMVFLVAAVLLNIFLI